MATTFEVYWMGEDAYRHFHKPDVLQAKAAWNAALASAVARLPGGDTCRPEDIADILRGLMDTRHLTSTGAAPTAPVI